MLRARQRARDADQIEGSCKMEKNAYGLRVVPKTTPARIQAAPFARYCIQCQSSPKARL